MNPVIGEAKTIAELKAKLETAQKALQEITHSESRMASSRARKALAQIDAEKKGGN
jgi:hypothetical protein